MPKVNTDESADLISADKVAGTTVYGPDRDKMGEITSVMIHKLGGQVAYAVLSIGGFLGIGTKYHPVPWAKLTYDTDLGGYRLNVAADRLKDAPAFDQPGGYDRDAEHAIYRYHDEPPYWS